MKRAYGVAMRNGSALGFYMLLPLLVARSALAQEGLPIYPAEPVDALPSTEAEAQRPRFDDQPWVIELRTGAGAAIGLAGVVLEYNVHDRLALNAGVGTNLLGVSSALGARVRPLIGVTRNHKQLHALVLEGAVSHSAYLGDPTTSIFCEDRCVQARYVGWAQAELGWEALGARFQLQTTLGAAFLLGHPQFSCHHEGRDSPANCDPLDAPARTLFSQTVSIGYAF